MTKMIENNDINRELLLDELSNFEVRKGGEIPEVLNKYLESVAQNGDTMFSWNKLQPLLRRKLELVMNDFHQCCPTDHLIALPNVKPFDFEELKQQILESIDAFISAPFTIQRLCELITNPSKHYKRTDKFMRGIEKNVLVVTTVEPNSANGNSNTHYMTSSFKTFFSSSHLTTNSSHSSATSLSTASTSLLVNGVSDMCDNQMSIHCSNESSLKPISCPVSPTSMPLSPTTNSPPNPTMSSLQQLDCFTTVFATSASTPLSVVSDLHSYEHSSSLCADTDDNVNDDELSSTTTPDIKCNEISDDIESTSKPELDSTAISSTTNSLQTNTLSDINSNINEITNNNDLIETKSESKEIIDNTIDSKESKDQLSETPDNSNESIDNNNEIIKTEESVPNDNKTVTSSDSSLETNNNIESNECLKADINSNETIGSDIESKREDSFVTEELKSVPENNEMIVNANNNQVIVANSDEDMSQPMDFCGSNANSNTILSTDITTNEMTADSNAMDESSDLSEPMDED